MKNKIIHTNIIILLLLLVLPEAVYSHHNFTSWNSVVKVLVEIVNEGSQFTVGSDIAQRFTATELPSTIFSMVVVDTFHSGENSVGRTVEVDVLMTFIDVIWCGFA